MPKTQAVTPSITDFIYLFQPAIPLHTKRKMLVYSNVFSGAATFSCHQARKKKTNELSQWGFVSWLILLLQPNTGSIIKKGWNGAKKKSDHSGVGCVCSWFPGVLPWDHVTRLYKMETPHFQGGWVELFHSFTRIVRLLLVVILNFTAALRLGSRCSPWTLSEIPHRLHLFSTNSKKKMSLSQPYNCPWTDGYPSKLTIDNPVVTAQRCRHERTKLILTIGGTGYHPLLSCSRKWKGD